MPMKLSLSELTFSPREFSIYMLKESPESVLRGINDIAYFIDTVAYFTSITQGENVQ